MQSVTIGPSAKRHSNEVLLASRLQPLSKAYWEELDAYWEGF